MKCSVTFVASLAFLTHSASSFAESSPGVRVRLSANEAGAELQQYRATDTVDYARPTPYGFHYGSVEVDRYSAVCAAPCDVTVDPRGMYRIGGPALHPTQPFRLIPDADNEINATLSTRGRRTAGKTLLYAGIPLTAVGGMFFAIGALSEDKVGCVGCVNYHRTGMLWGGILGGVGLGLLTTGIVVLAGASSSASINGQVVAVSLPGKLQLAADGLHF